MKKHFAFLCAAATLTFSFAQAAETPVAAPASVPSAAQITERWRAYFGALQNLPSWKYSSRMIVRQTDPKNPTAPAHLLTEMKYKFAKNNKLFRREMQVRESETGDFQKLTATYNGQKYQFAVHNPKAENINGHMMKNLMQQSLKPIPDDPTNTINMHFAVTMPFLFLSKENEMPISELAKAQIWAEVQGKITKIEPSTWENRPGFLLHFSPPDDIPDMKRGEVFVDSVSGLPLHVVSIGKETGKATGELKITKLQEATATTPAFPLLIEMTGAGTAEKPGGNGTIQVDPASLSFVPTFASDFFKIPASAVEIITEGDKVVYSRYPMPKEPAPKAKTPAPKTKSIR